MPKRLNERNRRNGVHIRQVIHSGGSDLFLITTERLFLINFFTQPALHCAFWSVFHSAYPTLSTFFVCFDAGRHKRQYTSSHTLRPS